ncbi:MAG: glycoside-pentoside-hexuronide (GPH):cation symporter [Eubacteriales bacterium]|nr:glycoside-pentoside-hexuronide (GPH):cation symporter [Eubacteriales bacterium]
MDNSQKLRPFGMRDKIGYAFGDMGCNFSFQLVSSYMYLFYTQCIGLSAANWAWIIVVSKVWDAINDILIGNMVDRKRIGKKSKFMPWIAIGSVALVVTSIMIFTPVTGFSQLGKIIWCLASYCLWSVAYTLINVPYGSLHSVITEDPKQRTTLSTFRSIGASLPAVLVMILPKVVYKDNVLDANILFVVAIIFSVVAFFVFFAMRKMVTERVVREDKVQEKVSYISTIKSFFTNRAMVAITIATVAVVVFYNSTMSVNNLVFQFYFNDAGKATLAMIASYIPLIGFMPFASSIVAKIGKKKLIVISGIVSVVSGILMLFLPITPDMKGIVIYVIGLMFVNTGCCVFQIIVWAIIADCIEMSYRKKGIREEASLYALYSFFRKLSQGIGSAIVALALSAVGYVETATTQTAQVSENIKNLYIIFLVAGLAVMTLSMWFIYDIDYKQEQEFGKTENAE